MIKLLKQWWLSDCFKNTHGQALVCTYFNTEKPAEFMAALREMRKRYGMPAKCANLHIAPIYPESRIINRGAFYHYSDDVLGWIL